MDKIQRLKQEKQYEEYVKQKTPQHNVWLNMLKAFLLGGTICFIGQVINHYCELKKLSADDCEQHGHSRRDEESDQRRFLSDAELREGGAELSPVYL